MIYSFVYVIALLAVLRVEAAVLTNGELYQILKESADTKEYSGSDVDDGYSLVEDTDSLIYLPGEADDEADIGSLMEHLGLLNVDEGGVLKNGNSNVGAGCSCHKDICTCCITKKFTVRVFRRTLSTTLKACVSVQYLPSKTSFLLTFVLQGKVVFKHVVSLNHPPKICGKLSGRVVKAEACLEIYNVNLGQKSLCTRLTGYIDFKVRKLNYRFNIACFKIPMVSRDWLAEIQQGEGQESFSAEAIASDDDDTMTAY